jgi:hypothetical protein
MEWNGMEWNGMGWDGMGWNGMEWNRIETLFHEGKRINHNSYLTYGPRTILIFTCIKSIKDLVMNTITYNLVNIYNLYKIDLRYG